MENNKNLLIKFVTLHNVRLEYFHNLSLRGGSILSYVDSYSIESEAIMNSFSWARTKEGYTFWSRIDIL